MENVRLYKLDSKNRQREWNIRVDGTTIVIEAGLLNGNLVPNRITITEGKNIGKANATTPYTQAVAEAQAKIELQLRSGYVRNLSELKESGTLGSGIPAPMLAQKYHPTGEQKGSKTLEKMKIHGQKIHVQPKLDGNRCLIRVSDYGFTMFTRKGDVMPVQLEHIGEEAVNNYNSIFSPKDPLEDTPVVILDGELFSDEMSFNELNGHLKRKDSQDLEALSKIKFHIYDVMEVKPYNERYETVKRFESSNVVVVPSYEIEATDENIKEKLEEFLAEGHEGLMIRTLDTGYENKRSWSLCKVKIFDDSEYKILDLEPDTMGRLGYFIMEMDKVVLDRDGKEVRTFKAGCTGVSHEEGKEMLANKHKYIGKMATIEYFGKDIRPRFPKYKCIRQD